MKINKNLLLLGVLGLLAITAWAYQGPIKNWRAAKTAPKNFFASLNFNKVDKISIKGKTAKFDLLKAGSDWRVDGPGKFNLDKQTVDQLVDLTNKSKVARLDLISTKKERQTEFGINETGYNVIMYQGKTELANFKVGRLANDYLSSYVANSNSDATYKLQNVNLTSLYGRPEWRDMTIFSLGGKTASSLRLQYPGRELKLSPKAANWTDGKATYRQDSINAIINPLLSLTASAIPEQNFKITSLEKPAVVVQIKGTDFDKTLMVGKKNGQEYFAKTGDSDNIYLIPKTLVDILLAGPKK